MTTHARGSVKSTLTNVAALALATAFVATFALSGTSLQGPANAQSSASAEAMAQLRSCSPEELRDTTFYFDDSRLAEMLFRYRARNYPDCLTADEQQQWEEYRYQRLTDPEAGASIAMEDFLEIIHTRLEDTELSERDRGILEQLLDYSDALLA